MTRSKAKGNIHLVQAAGFVTQSGVLSGLVNGRLEMVNGQYDEAYVARCASLNRGMRRVCEGAAKWVTFVRQSLMNQEAGLLGAECLQDAQAVAQR